MPTYLIDRLGTMYYVTERCIVDHPHHSLPLVLALANSFEDENYIPVTSPSNRNTSKVTKAQKLLDKYKTRGDVGQLVRDMDQLSKLFIRIANIDYKRLVSSDQLPAECMIDQMSSRLEHVALPTVTLNYNKNCTYTDVVGVKKIYNTFAFVGGNTKPKKMKYLGTDGLHR